MGMSYRKVASTRGSSQSTSQVCPVLGKRILTFFAFWSILASLHLIEFNHAKNPGCRSCAVLFYPERIGLSLGAGPPGPNPFIPLGPGPLGADLIQRLAGGLGIFPGFRFPDY